ncbi:hypothetical protein [Stenotrophomonas sp. GD03657]|uniref:hypothetical protein n=1 Tax=Stenotrophomonas sp. GD03657 TaxID=2975363 RepID=UPI002446E3EA|nr:hypothetical protein [Stenotrophomonas sp. GD03657]MDH2154174.1 hypothetical protein [Stenotrophomonas sp. GD03657]
MSTTIDYPSLNVFTADTNGGRTLVPMGYTYWMDVAQIAEHFAGIYAFATSLKLCDFYFSTEADAHGMFAIMAHNRVGELAIIGYTSQAIPQFYPDICDRYRQLLWPIRGNVCPDKLPREFSPSHLEWMLETIQFGDDQSLTKKHRWLGFVQAALIARGLTTVDDERDHTRPIFNGA